MISPERFIAKIVNGLNGKFVERTPTLTERVNEYVNVYELMSSLIIFLTCHYLQHLRIFYVNYAKIYG